MAKILNHWSVMIGLILSVMTLAGFVYSGLVGIHDDHKDQVIQNARLEVVEASIRKNVEESQKTREDLVELKTNTRWLMQQMGYKEHGRQD